jgi:hypothetical protein
VTDPRTSPTTPSTPEDLDPLLEDLSATITVGGDTLRECLTRLDHALRTRYRKDALQQLVARVGSAAAERENAFGLFIRAVHQLHMPVTPETAIRGLLLRRMPGGGDELLCDLLVSCLVPDTGSKDGARKGPALEVFVLSAPLLRDLKRSLGGQFPLLGVHVWDRARDQRSSPCWCEAWTRMSLDVLQYAIPAGKERRPDLAEPYAERLCQAEPAAARRMVSLLLFLKEEMGPLGEQVASRIRQAPVGAELVRQVSDLVVPPAVGAEGLLADLPEPVEAGLKSLLTYLRSLVQAQKTSAEELPALRQARQQVQEEVDQLRTALRSLEERQETLQSELARAREDRDAERRSREEVEHAHAALQAASGRQEKELRTTREDYERLAHRSDQDLGQIRQHVLDALHMDLRETWELMARMLEKVLQGQREPRHLASVWNQLDEILWGRLGTSGYPVDESPA